MYTNPQDPKIVAALAGYRKENQDLVSRVLGTLPTGKSYVATVSTKFQFVYQFYVVKDRTVGGAEVSELFYMCNEFFEFAGGTKPDNQPLHEFSIDFILGMLKEPFIMIAFQGPPLDYLLRKCRTLDELNVGRLMSSEYTTFLLYAEREVLSETGRRLPSAKAFPIN